MSVMQAIGVRVLTAQPEASGRAKAPLTIEEAESAMRVIALETCKKLPRAVIGFPRYIDPLPSQSFEELRPSTPRPNLRWAKAKHFLKQLWETGLDHLTQPGASAGRPALQLPVAKGVLHKIIFEVCMHYTGTVAYVPVNLHAAIDARDQAILKSYGSEGADGVRPFTWPRIDQIAAEHQLTTSHIYAIIRRHKLSETDANQPAVKTAPVMAKHSHWAHFV